MNIPENVRHDRVNSVVSLRKYMKDFAQAIENADPAAEGKSYDPEDYSGFGRTFLPKNMVDGVNVLTQEMMPVATGGNTVYVVRYDYDLDGQTIQIPDNCYLEFDGGSFSNGYISGSLLNKEIDMERINVADLSVFVNTLTLRDGQRIKLKKDAVYSASSTITIDKNDVVFDGNGATINSSARIGFNVGVEGIVIYGDEENPTLFEMEDASEIANAEIADLVAPGDVLKVFESTASKTGMIALGYTHGVETTVTDVRGSKVSLSIPVYRKQFDKIGLIKDIHGIELCNFRLINNHVNGSGYATQAGIIVNSHYSKVHDVFYDGADGAENGIAFMGTFGEVYNCEVCNVWHLKGGVVDNSAGYAINLAGNFCKAYGNRLYDNKSCLDGGSRPCTIYGIEVYDNTCSETFYRTKEAKENLPVSPPDVGKNHGMINFHGGIEGLYVHDNIVSVKYRSKCISIRCNGVVENNIIKYGYQGVDGSSNPVVQNYELSSNCIWRNNRIDWDESLDFTKSSYVTEISVSPIQTGEDAFETMKGSIIIEGNENWPLIVCQLSDNALNAQNRIDKLIIRNNIFAKGADGRWFYGKIRSFNKISIEHNYIPGIFHLTYGTEYVDYNEFYFRLNTVDIPSENTYSEILRLKANSTSTWHKVIVSSNRFINNAETSKALFSHLANCLNQYSIVSDNELVNVSNTKDSNKNLADTEDSSNKVTNLSQQSTDTQYPSAKAVFDFVKEEIRLHLLANNNE